MSHLKERKEKNCLNCNAQVMGKYCHICGQENIEPKETALHLINHFFQDITHFDGKFFNTVWLLISRPGFLSAEYARGRRASYLNPIRMYVFTSAFFFLVFFTIFKIDKEEMADATKNSTMNGKTIAMIDGMDSAQFADFTRDINKADKKPAVPMTREQFKEYYDSTIEHNGLSFSSRKYRSKAEYDSVLQSGQVHDGWFGKMLTYKQIEANEKYKNNPRAIFKGVVEALQHKLPQMLFISLPLLALLLKLLYIRRKEFYYVSHGIFSIHLYVFIFIALLFSFGLNKLDSYWHTGVISFLHSMVVLAIFFYVYKAMRNFYQQRRAKTILKYFLLIILFSMLVGILFTVFLLFSIFTI